MGTSIFVGITVVVLVLGAFAIAQEFPRDRRRFPPFRTPTRIPIKAALDN